jgi:hypothetical protein
MSADGDGRDLGKFQHEPVGGEKEFATELLLMSLEAVVRTAGPSHSAWLQP